MSKELIIAIVVFIVIWVYATVKMVKPDKMLNDYYMLIPLDLKRKFHKDFNFYVRVKQIALVGPVGYLIYYFLF
jgi:hypothetical protein